MARSGNAIRLVAGTLALAVAYYVAGQAGLALEYAGPVAAIWPPTGVGGAVLYLAGLRWWPGVVVGDLLLTDTALPVVSSAGLIAGDLADVLLTAAVLKRLLGPRARLDRLPQVGVVLAAAVAGAAVSASVAAAALRIGHVLPSSQTLAFWRTWLLSDASGGLVVMPLVIAWVRPPDGAWRGRGAWEGALMIATVAALSVLASWSAIPLTYATFPALIWAALRFGQQGATTAVAVATAIVVGITAHDVGTFATPSVTATTLSSQLYIVVTALTALGLAAMIGARRRLSEAEQRAGATRRGIAGDLYDSAMQSLRDVGLVIMLATRAAAVGARTGRTIALHGPARRLPLTPDAEQALYARATAALAELVAQRSISTIEVTATDELVTIELRDDADVGPAVRIEVPAAPAGDAS